MNEIVRGSGVPLNNLYEEDFAGPSVCTNVESTWSLGYEGT
jgi:hypothetical protein